MSEYEFTNIYGVTPQQVADAKAEAFRQLFIWSLPSIDPKNGTQHSVMGTYHFIPDIFQIEIVKAQFSHKIWRQYRGELLFDLVANRGPSSIDVKAALLSDPKIYVKPYHEEFLKLHDWMVNHFGADVTRDETRLFFTEQYEIFKNR